MLLCHGVDHERAAEDGPGITLAFGHDVFVALVIDLPGQCLQGLALPRQAVVCLRQRVFGTRQAEFRFLQLISAVL